MFGLILTISIAAVLMSLAAPSFSGLIHRAQFDIASDQLYSSLWYTRSQAISAQKSVVMAAESNGWAAGWQVFIDINSDGRQQEDEPVLRRVNAQPAGYSLTSNLGLGDAVYYQPDGRTRRPGGGLQMGTFTLCRPSGTFHKAQHHRVVINSAGRPRLERPTTHQTSDAC